LNEARRGEAQRRTSSRNEEEGAKKKKEQQKKALENMMERLRREKKEGKNRNTKKNTTKNDEPKFWIYKGDNEKIPWSVTHIRVECKYIPPRAFYCHLRLQEVELSTEVKSIGESAFFRCPLLQQVRFVSGNTSRKSSRLTHIGDRCFSDCTSLHYICLPDKLLSMGEQIFYGCSSLTVLAIPSMVGKIPSSAFQCCTSLQSIWVRNRITGIEDHAFDGCVSLESIIIPSSVNHIGEEAFGGCESLQNIVLPMSAVVKQGAFDGCTLLEDAVNFNTKDDDEIVKVEDWLKVRFEDLPFHALCYSSDSSSGMTHESLQRMLGHTFEGRSKNNKTNNRQLDVDPDAVKKRDWLGLSSLHVLLWSPCVTLAYVEALLGEWPDANRTTTNGNLYPLHSALANASDAMSLPILKRLCRDGFLPQGSSSNPSEQHVLMVPHPQCKSLSTTLAIKNHLCQPIQSYLYECHPIRPSSNDLEYMSKRLREMEHNYLEKLLSIEEFNSNEKEIKHSRRHCSDKLRQHGWVTYVGGVNLNINGNNDIVEKMICDRLSRLPKDNVRQLAFSKDFQDNVAISLGNKVSEALRQHALCLGRYELQNIIHQSDRSTIVQAIDWGSPNEEHDYLSQFQEMVQRVEETKDKRKRSMNASKQNNFLSLDNVKKFLKELIERDSIHIESWKDLEDTIEEWDLDDNNLFGVEEWAGFMEAIRRKKKRVVLKFISNEGVYNREIHYRNLLNQDSSRYVMPMIDHHISDDDFSNELELLHSSWMTSEGKKIIRDEEVYVDADEDKEYDTDDFDDEEEHDQKEGSDTNPSPSFRHLIVIPFAENTLEHMLADFTLTPVEAREILMNVAKALAYFHQRGILYANLRPSHIVFFFGKVRLIDLDSCVNIDENEEYKDDPVDLDTVLENDSPAAGNGRFVSGIMPPELVTILETDNDLQQYQSAILNKGIQEEEKSWNDAYYCKLLPQRCFANSKYGQKWYAIKAFCTEHIGQALPYDLVAAKPTYDVWSFGTVAYQLFSNGTPLFNTNRRGDLISLQDLHEFDPEAKLSLLYICDDEMKFLKTLLANDPQDRYRTMSKVLKDSYFTKKLPCSSLSMKEMMLQSMQRLPDEEEKAQQTLEDSLVTNAEEEESLTSIQKLTDEDEDTQDTSEDISVITAEEEETLQALEQLNKKIEDLTSWQDDATEQLNLKNKEIEILKSQNISLKVEVEKTAQKLKSVALVTHEVDDSLRTPVCCVQ